MASLERLIYVSRATRRSDSLLNLAEILAVSQRNNARDDLTGALAVHDGQYLQVVEGRREPLDQLLNRLTRDPRHEIIAVLARRAIDRREFGEWTMASARISPELAGALGALMADSKVSHERTVELMKAAVSRPA